MANVFDEKIKIETPSANVFNLTLRSRYTHYMGTLYPVLHKEILPGDRFRVSLQSLTRLAPMTNPVFDEVEIHYRAFFVPNRIIDPKWKQFITAGEGLYGTQDQEIDPLTFDLNNKNLYNKVFSRFGSSQKIWPTGVGSLADMLGIHYARYTTAADSSDNLIPGCPVLNWLDPSTGDIYTGAFNTVSSEVGTTSLTTEVGSQPLSFLPFLGYWKVFDDWYRNERFQSPVSDEITSVLGSRRSWPFIDGVSENLLPFSLATVNYGKDRFTTALPEPVVGGPVDAVSSTQGDFQLLSDTELSGTTIQTSADENPDGTYTVQTLREEPLFVRIAEAAATTVQQIKFAFRAYSFFMKDTYNGNRYVEFIQSHFDRRVPDSTLDRAIYLGSYKERISFGEVFQTAPGNGESSALGDYAGRGVAAGDGFLFDEEFLEHGQLYVMCSIVPRATYFQGIDRKFFKKDRFDYFFPEFQNIGDVALFNKELFYKGDVNGERVLGYQSRWIELKESLDELHGEFLTSMRSWHFAREFADSPRIGENFSKIPQINNPFAVLEDWTENYMFDVRFNIEARRPLYYYEQF